MYTQTRKCTKRERYVYYNIRIMQIILALTTAAYRTGDETKSFSHLPYNIKA